MASTSNRDGASDRTEHAAAYIADMTAELAKMARGAKLDMLAYLLDIAELEARGAAGRESPAGSACQEPRPASG